MPPPIKTGLSPCKKVSTVTSSLSKRTVLRQSIRPVALQLSGLMIPRYRVLDFTSYYQNSRYSHFFFPLNVERPSWSVLTQASGWIGPCNNEAKTLVFLIKLLLPLLESSKSHFSPLRSRATTIRTPAIHTSFFP